MEVDQARQDCDNTRNMSVATSSFQSSASTAFDGPPQSQCPETAYTVSHASPATCTTTGKVARINTARSDDAEFEQETA